MTFGWLKRYMPRSLYARAALILALPVITIQLVVSVVFIQRHFEGVTRQMTRNVILELSEIQRQVDAAPLPAAARSSVGQLAEALNIALDIPAEPLTADTRVFYDFSGRIMSQELRVAFPEITGIDPLTIGLFPFRRVGLGPTIGQPHRLKVVGPEVDHNGLGIGSREIIVDVLGGQRLLP